LPHGCKCSKSDFRYDSYDAKIESYLVPNERIIKNTSGSFTVKHVQELYDTVDFPLQIGNLVFTDQRLILLGAKGTFSTKYNLIYDIPFTSVNRFNQDSVGTIEISFRTYAGHKTVSFDMGSAESQTWAKKFQSIDI
jgi:hypothetical protein